MRWLAESGFDALANGAPQGLKPRQKRAFGVFLALTLQHNLPAIEEQVLLFVVGVSAVAVNLGAFWQVQGQAFEGGDIGHACGGKQNFDGMARSGDKQMDFETEIIAAFTGAIAPMLLALE